MIDLEKALEESKNIIYQTIYEIYTFLDEFRDYGCTYFVTSECIKDYLEAQEFKKDRALTILSGGDQVFNLITSGVYEIDAFDSNKLTYFVYHLRKAMLNVFSFQDFKKVNFIFSSARKDFPNHFDIIKKVKPYLPEEVHEYFRKILEFSKIHPMPTRNISSLYYDVHKIDFSRNNYLVNEETYKKLQKSINDANVNITFADALTFPKELQSKYDIILLSNVADYFSNINPEFGPKEFQEFIANYMRILNPDGILINYLYRINEKYPIRNLSITKEDIGPNNIYPVTNPVFREKGEGYYLGHKPKIKQYTNIK